MTCEVCGTEVPATARFCPGCGAPATTPATSAPMPEAVARAWATLAGTAPALPLLGVGVGAAGLLQAVIGLAIATGEEPLSMGFLHGSIWLDLGIVLEGGAFALFAAARGRRAVPPWVASTSRLAAAAGAVLTLVFAIVALAVVFGDLTAEDLADGGAWAGFSGAWTTFVLGWLTWCRPLSRREGVGAGGNHARQRYVGAHLLARQGTGWGSGPTCTPSPASPARRTPRLPRRSGSPLPA